MKHLPFLIISVGVFYFAFLYYNQKMLNFELTTSGEYLAQQSNELLTAYRELRTKYIQINQFQTALARIDPNQYQRNGNNCLDYARRLQQELAGSGIESSIFINKGRNHAWLGVWIEATDGQFINPASNTLQIIEVRDSKMDVVLADPVLSKVNIPTGTFPILWTK